MSMYIIYNDINNVILKYLERKKEYVVYHNNLNSYPFKGV
jgi:hypothetical protein